MGSTFIYETLSKALEHIQNNTQKWENALAVQYKTYDIHKAKIDKGLASINKKVDKLNKEYSDYCTKEYNIVLTKIKSKAFVSCPCCKSKINTKYYDQGSPLKCSVCGGSFRTKAQIEKRIKLETNIKKLEQDREDLHKKLKAKYSKASGTKWVMGGHAAC